MELGGDESGDNRSDEGDENEEDRMKVQVRVGRTWGASWEKLGDRDTMEGDNSDYSWKDAGVGWYDCDAADSHRENFRIRRKIDDDDEEACGLVCGERPCVLPEKALQSGQDVSGRKEAHCWAFQDDVECRILLDEEVAPDCISEEADGLLLPSQRNEFRRNASILDSQEARPRTSFER